MSRARTRPRAPCRVTVPGPMTHVGWDSFCLPLYLVCLLVSAFEVFDLREASAWGARGHVWINGMAAARLPDEVPAFLRTREIIDRLGALGPEPDRSRNSGRTHDSERDPGHYMDTDDAGDILGIVPLVRVPD